MNQGEGTKDSSREGGHGQREMGSKDSKEELLCRSWAEGIGGAKNQGRGYLRRKTEGEALMN